MTDNNENLIGQKLALYLGETQLLTGTIEGYVNGEFTVSCPFTDTETGEIRYAQVKVSPNDKDTIFTMTIPDQQGDGSL